MTDEQITALNDHKKGCEGRTYTCTCGYDDAQAAEIARLREAKWIVRHADTANDMVLIGMARDSAIAERDAARDENARLRELVHLYVDRSNVRLEHEHELMMLAWDRHKAKMTARFGAALAQETQP